MGHRNSELKLKTDENPVMLGAATDTAYVVIILDTYYLF